MNLNDQIEFWAQMRGAAQEHEPNQVGLIDEELHLVMEIKRFIGDRTFPEILIDGLAVGEEYSCGMCQEAVWHPHRCPGYLYW